MTRTFALTLVVFMFMLCSSLSATHTCGIGVGGGICYISSAGSDANSGATTSLPWAHAPGMTGCVNVCASQVPIAGDQYSFRGGDTWTASGVTNWWTWSWAGTNGSHISIGGIDQTFFVGGAWSRPILTGGGTWPGTSNAFMLEMSGGSNFVEFEFMECTGLFWTTNNNFAGCVRKDSTSFFFHDNYTHGWSHGTGADAGVGLECANGADSTSRVYNNVWDGSDTTKDSFTAFGDNSGSCPVSYQNYFAWTVNGFDGNFPISWHDNLFFNAGVSDYAGGLLHNQDFESNEDTANFVFYNNVLIHMNPSASGGIGTTFAPFAANTTYIFNNVFADELIAANEVQFSGAISGGGGAVKFFNNTEECGADAGPPSQNCIYMTGAHTPIPATSVAINNHYITSNTTLHFDNVNNCNGSTGCVVNSTTPLTQTLATANGQGYKLSQTYVFSPTAIGNGTVGVGTNESAICTTISGFDAAAGAACTFDTTYAVSYSSGTHTVTFPGRVTIPRPSVSAWDIGAYELGSGVILPQLCVVPFPYARCDLVTAILPSVPPSAGPNTCVAGSLNNCGNLTGAGKCWMDPLFGNQVCRLTDSTSGKPSNLFQTKTVAESGSGDEQLMNCNSSMMLYDDSGSRTYPNNFFDTGLQMYITRMYPSDPAWSANNGFFVNTSAFWGHNCGNPPARMYDLGNGLAGTAGAAGSILGYWDFTNQAVVPSFTQLFDFKSTSACLGGSYTVTWTTVGGSDQTDTDFAFGFSNAGGQGTGVDVVVWRSGSGCRHLNLTTLTVSGDWGPTGAIVGSGCAGGTIHNVKILKQGGSSGALEIDYAAPCGSPSQPVYTWQYPGLNFGPECTAKCTGHWTGGLLTWANQSGDNVPNYITVRPYTTPGSFTGIIPAVPVGGAQGGLDFHLGNNALDDTKPFVASSIILGTPITKAWSSEILGFNPAGGVNPWRFINHYATGANPDFSTKEAIGAISQDLRYFIYSSDHLDTLGGVTGLGASGTATCTTGNAGNCRGDVFVARLNPTTPLTYISPSFFGGDWNNISATPPPPVWPPTDSLGHNMSINGFRIWDNGMKWSQIETSSGTFTWTKMDESIRVLTQNPAMRVIYTEGSTPVWASSALPAASCSSPSTTHSCVPPNDLDGTGGGTDAQFQLFMSTLAARYPNQITYYAIRNEADSANFWCWNDPVCGGGGDPKLNPNVASLKNLVRMAWDMWNIVHCLSPASFVLSPTFHGPTALTWMHNYVITSINAPAGSIAGCSWNAVTVTGKMTFDITDAHLRGTPNPDPTTFLGAYTNAALEIANDSLPTVLFDDEFGYIGTAQAANTDIQAADVAIGYILRASVTTPPIQQAYWYQVDAAQGPLQGQLPGTAYDTVAQWLIGSRIGTCTIITTNYTCAGFTQASLGFVIAWDMSQNCTAGCTTTNQIFGAQYSTYYDLLDVSHATTGGNGTAPVGLKPILLVSTPAPPPAAPTNLQITPGVLLTSGTLVN